MTTTTLRKQALLRFISTINTTGGIVQLKDGTAAPAADVDWIDLGDAYLYACEAMNVKPKITIERN